MKGRNLKSAMAIALAACMSASVLTGCGGGQPQSGQTGQPESGTGAAQEPGGAPSASGNTQEATGVVIGPDGGATTADALMAGLESVTSSKDTLVMRMDADPGTLDNLTTQIMNGNQILSMVNCGLMRNSYNEEMGIIYEMGTRYAIAQDYELAEDKNSVIWTIREDAKWHDGNPVTVEDILFSISRYQENSQYDFIDYSKLDKIDDTHFSVGFVRQDANAIVNIGTMTLVEKSVFEAVGSEQYFTTTAFVGCGAYEIKDWVAGDTMTLEAVDGYFGGDPKIKKIMIRFIAEASVAMMELETGGVDVIDIPNWTDVSNVMKGNYEGVAKHLQIPDSLYTMVGYNLSEDSPCRDLLVRQAIAYAIDRDTVAQGAYEGVGEVAYTFFSGNVENMKVFSEEEWPYDHNVEKAKELLSQAGYGDGFKMTILTNQDANRSMAAQIIKSQLSEVGIEAEIVNYDNATYAATMSGETDSWDIWLRNWTTTGTCWSQYFTLIVKTNCHPDENDDTWKKYTDYAAAMAGELDEAARYDIEDKVQETVMDDALYTYNLIAPVKHIILSDNLCNIERANYSWNVLDAYFK